MCFVVKQRNACMRRTSSARKTNACASSGGAHIATTRTTMLGHCMLVLITFGLLFTSRSSNSCTRFSSTRFESMRAALLPRRREARSSRDGCAANAIAHKATTARRRFILCWVRKNAHAHQATQAGFVTYLRNQAPSLVPIRAKRQLNDKLKISFFAF